MKKKLIIGIVLVMAAMVYFEISRLPERSDKFEEVAYVRNENNQGAVLLYYAFAVTDIDSVDIKVFGNTLPHNNHSGITTAFMFDKKKGFPNSLSLEYPHFDTAQYKPFAVYIKDKVGNVRIETGI